jgi:hypothetical protein
VGAAATTIGVELATTAVLVLAVAPPWAEFVCPHEVINTSKQINSNRFMLNPYSIADQKPEARDLEWD